MKKTILVFAVFVLTGCATIADTPKNVIGFSTRDMEVALVKATTEDFQADFTGLFDTVLDVAKENKYYIFTQDEVRGLIVLMNIPGFVDTTEVGVFITPLKVGAFMVEVSSRSSPAKEAVAKVILGKLEDKFKKI
jgi:uncharacterized protein YceK